jgi:hypothetical protein
MTRRILIAFAWGSGPSASALRDEVEPMAADPARSTDELGRSPRQISSRWRYGPRRIAGIASEPDSAWVVQCGRQLTDAVDGFLVRKRFLLHDRDPLFSASFRETLAATGVETVRLPPRAPNLNVHAEPYVRTIKEALSHALSP